MMITVFPNVTGLLSNRAAMTASHAITATIMATISKFNLRLPLGFITRLMLMTPVFMH